MTASEGGVMLRIYLSRAAHIFEKLSAVLKIEVVLKCVCFSIYAIVLFFDEFDDPHFFIIQPSMMCKALLTPRLVEP